MHAFAAVAGSGRRRPPGRERCGRLRQQRVDQGIDPYLGLGHRSGQALAAELLVFHRDATNVVDTDEAQRGAQVRLQVIHVRQRAARIHAVPAARRQHDHPSRPLGQQRHAGVVVALMSLALVAGELRAGSLLRPFGPELETEPFYLVHAESRREDCWLATLREWILGLPPLELPPAP